VIGHWYKGQMSNCSTMTRTSCIWWDKDVHFVQDLTETTVRW